MKGFETNHNHCIYKNMVKSLNDFIQTNEIIDTNNYFNLKDQETKLLANSKTGLRTANIC